MKKILLLLFVIISVCSNLYANRVIQYADMCQQEYSLIYKGRSIHLSFAPDSVCMVQDGTIQYNGKVEMKDNRITIYNFNSDINYMFVGQFIWDGIYEMYICKNGNILWQAFNRQEWQTRKNTSDFRLERKAKLKRNKCLVFKAQ